MPFSINRTVVQQFSAIIDNVSEIKDVIDFHRADIASGNYAADRLIILVQSLKKNVDALESIKLDLNLNGGNIGSFVSNFNAVLDKTNNFLSSVRTNIPTSNGFLLLFTMDVNFNLKPRIFTGGTLTTLDNKLNAILQEIS